MANSGCPNPRHCTHRPCDITRPEQEELGSSIFARLQVVLRCPKSHCGLVVPTQSPSITR